MMTTMAHPRYGIGLDMDFVAASFVRNAAQVEEIRAHIKVIVDFEGVVGNFCASSLYHSCWR